MNQRRILIIGSWKMPHVRRFVKYICVSKDDSICIDFLDNSYVNVSVDCENLNHVYRIRNNVINRILMRIPKIRIKLVEREICKRLEEILEENKYDLINMQVVHGYAWRIVDIANRHGAKILLSPFGSEVIRISESKKKLLKKAFKNSTYVATKENSSFSEYLTKSFGVKDSQFVSFGAGSETITSIIRLRGLHSREEMSSEIGIPCSSYNICCGYNAQFEQRHEQMMRAIADNISILPSDYQVIVPLTYGSGKKELMSRLFELSKELSLNTVFLLDFMSSDKVSFLRMITDLFIHVQTTDAANASIQEFLLAGATCINGSWLSYPYLETEGAPYYLCDSINDLSEIVKQAIQGEKKPEPLHQNTIQTIENCSIDKVVENWLRFYRTA